MPRPPVMTATRPSDADMIFFKSLVARPPAMMACLACGPTRRRAARPPHPPPPSMSVFDTDDHPPTAAPPAPPTPASSPRRAARDPPRAAGRRGGEGGVARRRKGRWRWSLCITIPVVLLGAAVAAWAYDTREDDAVVRNVTLAGVDIGTMSEAELTDQVAELADAYQDTPVNLEVVTAPSRRRSASSGPGRPGRHRRGRTGHRPRRLGRGPALRLGAVVLGRRDRAGDLPPTPSAPRDALVTLQGDERTPPVEPSIQVVEDRFEVVPGHRRPGHRRDGHPHGAEPRRRRQQHRPDDAITPRCRTRPSRRASRLGRRGPRAGGQRDVGPAARDHRRR